MKEQERYSSLKRAMQRRENKQKKLSTNFTYTTMVRVREAAVAREKRENRIQFFATIAASLLMIIGAIYIIVPIMGNYTFSIIPRVSICEHIDTLKLYAPIFIALILLLLLDIKLRAIFKKKLNQ